MPTNDYKPLANDAGADVETQAQYLIDLGVGGSLEHGYKTGKALSAQVNKTFRQCSMVAAAIAQTISDVLAIDVLDDGNLAALVVNLKAMLSALSWSTGDVKLTYKAVADAGWLLVDDTSIGSAGSGATHAGAAYQALYTLWWTNIAQPSGNAYCAVAGGLGGSAAADWAANKKMSMTKALGRALAISGAGLGLTARALGSQLGNEAHVQQPGEVGTHNNAMNDPGHNHGVNDPGHVHLEGWASGPQGAPFNSVTLTGQPVTPTNTGGAVTGITLNPSGTGVTTQAVNGAGPDAMNIMNPVSYFNAMVKL